MANPHGAPQNLVAAHPGNSNSFRYGIRSPRLREPRAIEVQEAILSAPHVSELDAVQRWRWAVCWRWRRRSTMRCRSAA